MLKMYFALFLQEKEAVRRVMIQRFSGVCEFLMNFRDICYPVLHLPSVHLSPANCFQAPCQDVYSRPLHDSFTHECHTETSSSKSLLTPAMISNSKIWLFPYMCSLKIHSSIRGHLSTPHLQCQRWAWSQGHLHSWSSSPMSHDGYMPGKNRSRGPDSQPGTPCPL